MTHIYIEGHPSYSGPTLNDVATNRVNIKDLNINNIVDCNYWLSMDPKSLPLNILLIMN